MKKITVTATASATNVEDNFNGTLTLSDEKNAEKKFDWTCEKPDSKQIKFRLQKNDKPYVELIGIPTADHFTFLNKEQQALLSLCIEIVPEAIENHKFILQNGSTAPSNTATLQETVRFCEVEDSVYILLFP